MSDLPQTLLLQQSHAQPMSGEELELLGKRAAALYAQGSCPLTQAVVETVKHAGLGPEQVRRVAEFANVSAYLDEFKKMGSDHRYVQFQGGPADVPTILRDLNDGGGGTVFDRGLADYSRPPPEKVAEARTFTGDDGLDKTASLDFNPTETAFEQMWQTEGQPLPYADPLKDAYDLYTKLADARQQVGYEMSVLEGAFRELGDFLFSRVKQASLEGIPLGHVVQAWSSITDNPDLVKSAFLVLTPRLLDDQVFGSRDSIAESLQKTAGAGAFVDPSHELVGSFREFCQTLNKLAESRALRAELDQAHDYIGAFLLDALDKTAASRADDVVSALESGAHKARAGWDAATRATAAAAPGVERVVGALGGPLAGRLAGGAVKYSPHAAAALAAETAYQHARYSPAFQGAKNFVLGRIPYTHPYLVRQYDLQMRGGF